MPPPPRRWPLVLVLLASLAWLGLVAGTAAGAAWLVPEGSGLAGPAIALGYGVLGLLAGVALGSGLAWRAGYGPLRKAAVAAVALALLSAAAIVLLATGCAAPVPAGHDASASGWLPVWADEFDGDRLDRGSWTVELMPDPHNEELQYYTDRADGDPGANVWLEDGVLVIEARREDFEHRRYTSARINTRGKREFLYGRFEARMRQPGETGMWPAFWLLGATIGEVGWPACGEIDVVEGKGRFPEWTSGALHAGPDPAGNRIVSFSQLLPRGEVHSSWHVFAVEWEPAAIRWFVDGEQVFTVRRPDDVEPVYWPFDHGHPFFLILNLAVGGWFDPGHPPPEDMAPQRLLVDWVRVYRQTPRFHHNITGR